MNHYVNIDVDGFSIINNSVVVVVVIVMPPFFTLLTFWKNGMVFHFISNIFCYSFYFIFDHSTFRICSCSDTLLLFFLQILKQWGHCSNREGGSVVRIQGVFY